MTVDSQGNLYGTALSGGSAGFGTVFKVTPDGQLSVLYTFLGGSDGSVPVGGVILDGDGNLYGTTASGGGNANCTGGCGTVFKLSPAGQETIVHSFGAAGDGQSSYSGLVADTRGNFYGVTYAGGAAGAGVVFKVTAKGKESVLYAFAAGNDGANPEGALILDAKGNIYGDTSNGGGSCNCGTVFKLSKNGAEKVLHSFSKSDGGYPYGGLTRDSTGNLFGTTYSGGTHNYGVVYEITSH
ncbi:MAG: choice-of-anchor tandem repeat GloVer-containing protein [Rhizomicrobium sp.]